MTQRTKTFQVFRVTDLSTSDDAVYYQILAIVQVQNYIRTIAIVRIAVDLTVVTGE